jgi:hypothetical protein
MGIPFMTEAFKPDAIDISFIYRQRSLLCLSLRLSRRNPQLADHFSKALRRILPLNSPCHAFNSYGITVDCPARCMPSPFLMPHSLQTNIRRS